MTIVHCLNGKPHVLVSVYIDVYSGKQYFPQGALYVKHSGLLGMILFSALSVQQELTKVY